MAPRQPPPKDAAINIACSHLLPLKHFLVWRLVSAIYFWTVFIWSQISSNSFGKTLIYLTIWTLILCTLYMTLSLYCTYLYYQHVINLKDGSFLKCCNYCYHTEKVQILATVLSLTVVIAFWALLYEYADISDPLNIQIHGTTMIFTVIDFYLCYSQITFRSTYWYLIVIGITYIIWSITYQFVTNEAIYPVLNWKNEPIVAFIVTVAVSILTLIIHALLCWSNKKLLSEYFTNDEMQLTLAENLNEVEISQNYTIDTAEK